LIYGLIQAEYFRGYLPRKSYWSKFWYLWFEL